MRRLLRSALVAVAVSGALAAPVMAQGRTYRIGVSSLWIGNDWRTQMIGETMQEAAAWHARGVDIDLIVHDRTGDVLDQLAEVQGFIDQGVDAILATPDQPTALAPLLARARRAGILVFTTDGMVGSQQVLYVGIDPRATAQASAAWLARALGGKGRVVTINGIAGDPRNETRITGWKEMFGMYPDIKVVATTNAGWDEERAQAAAKGFLTDHPALNGIWMQHGEAAGGWRAIAEANRPSVVATGEPRAGFVRQWMANSWDTAAVVNPPGGMATALNVAVLMLEGGRLKPGSVQGPYGNALYLPPWLVSNDTMAQVVRQLDGKPDDAFVSMVLEPDALLAMFFL